MTNDQPKAPMSHAEQYLIDNDFIKTDKGVYLYEDVNKKVIRCDLQSILEDFAAQTCADKQKELETVNITLSRVIKDKRELNEELADKQAEIDKWQQDYSDLQTSKIQLRNSYEELKIRADKMYVALLHCRNMIQGYPSAFPKQELTNYSNEVVPAIKEYESLDKGNKSK